MLGKAYTLSENQGLLDGAEVKYTVSKVREQHPEATLTFVSVDHLEWTKDELLKALESDASTNGTALKCERFTRCTSMDVATNETFIDVVRIPMDGDSSTSMNSDGADANVESQVLKNSVQPPMSPTEYESVAEAIKAYEPLREVLSERGLDPECLLVDAWCVGYSSPEDGPQDRQSFPVLLYKESGDDIPYTRPLEGIHMRYSITQSKVLSFNADEFENFKVPVPSPVQANYATEERQTVAPLDIVQGDGVSFTVTKHSNHIVWEGWDVQVGFTSREGLTLHCVTFQGRPILHKLSVTEMVVPYGDPRPQHCKKAAFDAGEDGFGRNANSLKLGCDCLGLIKYLDAHLVGDNGDVLDIANAVCIHEEDAGIAWKHSDWRTGESQVRRGRKLIISFITTIANYDYGFYYEFYQDGRISLDVKLTGVLSTGLLSIEDEAAGGRKYGTFLGMGNLYAPIHQHFFNARIHTAVDGALNSLMESNVVVEPLDSPDNTEGNAFYYETKTLRSEMEAQRSDDAQTQRYWKVQSSDTTNRAGEKTAFRLVAANPCRPMASMASKQLGRAGFMKHTLWATAFHRDERYPAGEFPNQCNTTEGLEKWTVRDASLIDTDLVLWYNFGVTHLPRLEDFPVMPVEHTGFHLKPVGFFNESPIMDLPQTTHDGLSEKVIESGTSKCCSE